MKRNTTTLEIELSLIILPMIQLVFMVEDIYIQEVTIQIIMVEHQENYLNESHSLSILWWTMTNGAKSCSNLSSPEFVWIKYNKSQMSI